MAKSRFEYVKQFERENFLLPETHILVRVDGKGFHKFSEEYKFEKPNDQLALLVMNTAASKLMAQFPDILMAYGDSDEYSFLLRRTCDLFERREMKIVLTFASFMTANYIMAWNLQFPENPLRSERLPTFDARAVVYPNAQTVRDYFSWRQADCHINNLFNTAFWGLVKLGLSPKDAENELLGTLASDKNEILFKRCGINYNNEPEIYRKGTVIVREYGGTFTKSSEEGTTPRQQQRQEKARRKARIEIYHRDIIQDEFWLQRPWLLE